MKKKKCSYCKTEKPLDQFHKDASLRDGVGYGCKKCVSVKSKNSYERRKGTDSYKKQKALGQRKYIQRNPKRALAHRLARRNRDNLINETCESCGDNGKLHLHHPNVDEPLNVVTLCIKCHEQAHHGVFV